MNRLGKLSDLKSALKQLKDGAEKAEDELDRDGVIQRFEFTFELLWKVIQEYVKFEGLETASPRDAFRVASDLGVVDDPVVWFDFLKDRNLTTHLYSKEDAVKIFSHIPIFITKTEELISKIEGKLQEKP